MAAAVAQSNLRLAGREGGGQGTARLVTAVLVDKREQSGMLSLRRPDKAPYCVVSQAAGSLLRSHGDRSPGDHRQAAARELAPTERHLDGGKDGAQQLVGGARVRSARRAAEYQQAGRGGTGGERGRERGQVQVPGDRRPAAGDRARIRPYGRQSLGWPAGLSDGSQLRPGEPEQARLYGTGTGGRGRAQQHGAD